VVVVNSTKQKWSYRCELLLRAKLVPDRAGADTQVIAHIPLSQLRQLPGAHHLEDAWIRARLGEDGYLAGAPDPAGPSRAPEPGDTPGPGQVPRPGEASGPGSPRSSALSPEPWRALRHAMAHLAVDLVSGPAGVAAILRQHLLTQPCNSPSLPLDIGYSDTIPWHIRRAVLVGGVPGGRSQRVGREPGVAVPVLSCTADIPIPPKQTDICRRSWQPEQTYSTVPSRDSNTDILIVWLPGIIAPGIRKCPQRREFCQLRPHA
jgi:hypothetical protein